MGHQLNMPVVFIRRTFPLPGVQGGVRKGIRNAVGHSGGVTFLVELLPIVLGVVRRLAPGQIIFLFWPIFYDTV